MKRNFTDACNQKHNYHQGNLNLIWTYLILKKTYDGLKRIKRTSLVPTCWRFGNHFPRRQFYFPGTTRIAGYEYKCHHGLSVKYTAYFLKPIRKPFYFVAKSSVKTSNSSNKVTRFQMYSRRGEVL